MIGPADNPEPWWPSFPGREAGGPARRWDACVRARGGHVRVRPRRTGPPRGTLASMRTSPPAADDSDALPTIRDALVGVRALVLDVDGVLLMKGAALPGAAEALATLETRGIPFRVATNFTAAHRGTLAARFQAAGLAVPEERIVTAASVSAARTAASYSGQLLFVITTPDGRREFDGQHVLPLSLIHISEPTRRTPISYAVFCLKKK